MLYTTVLDLSRFISTLLAGGKLPDGDHLLARATLDSMWTPQYVKAGETKAAEAPAPVAPTVAGGDKE